MLNFGVEQAASAKLRTWTGPELSTVAPRTRTLLSTSDPAEIELALELHERFGTLDFAAADGANPWGLGYHTLFHSSGAKKAGLLIRDEQLLKDGYQLRQDKIFEHPDGRLALPVYEGQMATRWDHRARTFEGYTGPNKYRPKPGIPVVTDEQHADPNFEVEPRYWMSSETAEERINQVVGSRALLAMRDVGRPWKDRRVMRAAVFPRLPATHKLPVLSIEPAHMLRAAALLNSMVFDFLVRVHLSGGSLAAGCSISARLPRPKISPPKWRLWPKR